MFFNRGLQPENPVVWKFQALLQPGRGGILCRRKFSAAELLLTPDSGDTFE